MIRFAQEIHLRYSIFNINENIQYININFQ